MKQLLLATAIFVGMSSAALATEPVALTDSQLDNVTAGQNVETLLLPVALAQGGTTVFGLDGGGNVIPLATAGTSGFSTNLVYQTIVVPAIQ